MIMLPTAALRSWRVAGKFLVVGAGMGVVVWACMVLAAALGADPLVGPAAAAAVWITVLLPFGVDYSIQQRTRWVGSRGKQPRCDVRLVNLAALPPGQGFGTRLIVDALADVDDNQPPGTVLALEPADSRTAALYARHGFTFAPDSHWMVRTTGR